MFAEVFPNKLTIETTNNKIQNKLPSLNLKNITDNYLLYKTFINTRGVLNTKPATSFIKPLDSVSIEINILNDNLPTEEYKKTKLLLMVFKSDEDIKTNEQAKQQFKLIKNEKNKEIEKQEILINLNVNDTDNEEKNVTNNEENVDERITFINYGQFKAELDSKNNEIKKNLEIQRKKLENLVGQENKTNSIKGKRKKYYNLDNLIIVFLLLIGLIIGANFANGYNKLFKK